MPRRTSLAREDLGEEIAEGALLHRVHARREVEPLETGRRVRGLRLITKHVIPPAPFRVTQGLVGLRDVLETHRRHVVARVEVGMIAARQPAVRTLHVHHRRRARHAEHHVEVHR
jgi:hypothetical protein